ncbi:MULTISPECIES: patatin-like phospholipase family protein [Alteromonadaceae]|uniref:patatin-like phospholipase family protein n=1 Tax=Alteromonadaceae TaxID=72275 RepID=UPI001C09F79D|nr:MULTISPECIES: patatin-like phospholipase family protein [Aliiglaciecola]MBU2876359.1 patatin-like phospholipase family protein [Aliiglaciecola lipolytica]MDO6710575.1 patatin-like phospholipase family protein [Aliiglaciecola sp. 2_MG-2023]MDO6751560.1 patatin-like phospholipase family protein [Aliiglaciecola sp. 1_MG-2023]
MKIGLALGSGAARGWAHIGIIQALEELGIKVDVVAGCSIGAYVGAAYASNKLDPLAEWASSLTEWQVLGLLGVGFRKGGLASGIKVFKALEDNFCERDFEHLSKPLGVVATDLYSGKEVSFTQGPIADAVRASCAIPALFPPIAHKGRWLVDGAVVNPVPVNLCRQLGADFVFAVNLSADFRPEVQAQYQMEHENNQKRTNDFFNKSQSFMQRLFSGKFKKDNDMDDDELESLEDLENMALDSDFDANSEEQITTSETQVETPEQVTATQKSSNVKLTDNTPSMLGVMSSSLDILQARVTRSRLAGDPPDILIEPQLRDFGIMEFHRAAELIEEGRQSVNRVAAQIKYQLRLD